MSKLNNAVGGYFELELPSSRSTKYDNAIKYQSARAAFLALLRTRKPSRVWMPRYICDSMLAPVTAMGVDPYFYSLDECFGIIDDVVLRSTDILLYVNYFGVCFGEMKKVLERLNRSQVVLDLSQAFYTEPQDCLATIYSPRKFFGIPDGGLMFTQLAVELPEKLDEGSAGRTRHLITRLGGQPESGYADYKRAETELNEFEPKRMSLLTERIFSSIDFEAIRIKRNKNFMVLHQVLGKANRLKIDDSKIDGPFCYPYLTKRSSLRNKLIAGRVFVATYWTDVLSRVSDSSFEGDLAHCCLPLPCDQRYSVSDMERICHELDIE